MGRSTWKVGEVARRTGLTIRTLHHYDAIGLLVPSGATASGHRLYAESDLARLLQIRALRQLGLSLGEIRASLGDAETSPLDLVERQLDRIRGRIRQQERVRDRLEALADGLRRAESPSAELFFRAIEEMTMFEKYYTPEQLDQLKRRAEQVGEARIREVEAEWPALMAEVRAEMEKGTDPADPVMQALARRWKGLVEEFTGGDPGIARSLGNLYKNEEVVQGMDVAPMREMMTYVGKALATLS